MITVAHEDIQKFDIQKYDIQKFDIQKFNIQKFDIQNVDIQKFCSEIITLYLETIICIHSMAFPHHANELSNMQVNATKIHYGTLAGRDRSEITTGEWVDDFGFFYY